MNIELTTREVEIIKELLLSHLSSSKYTYSVRDEMNNLDDRLEKASKGSNK